MPVRVTEHYSGVLTEMSLLDLLEFHEYRKMAKTFKQIEKSSRKLQMDLAQFENSLDEEDDFDYDELPEEDQEWQETTDS